MTESNNEWGFARTFIHQVWRDYVKLAKVGEKKPNCSCGIGILALIDPQALAAPKMPEKCLAGCLVQLMSGQTALSCPET
jgi:hypothetical protein